MIEVAVVVCTYHRERLLGDLLASLQAQDPPTDGRCEIIVVDNSDEGTARPVAAAARGPFPVRWIEAHPANISVARNAGVAASEADWVAFVDDDQTVETGWLAALIEAARGGPHDVLFGAVLPCFEASARPTPRAIQLFSRQIAADAGADLFAIGPRKTAGVALATNNCALRRAAMPSGAAPFDLAFGAGGGEDYDLFCRMQAGGARFGWAPAMRAREFVPASRCDTTYLRRRFFAGGQAFAAAAARASDRPRATRWLLRARAFAQAAALAALYPLRATQGQAARDDHSFALAGALGKASFGAIAPIYRAFDQKTRGALAP